MDARRSPADHAQYDLIVIGGGPAGLSAALYLGRSRRRTLVLDAGQPRNAPSPRAHGVFSRDGTPPGQLLADARQQLAEYPTVEFCGLEATRTEAGPLGIVVRLANGTEVRARRLLLACGVRDELPSIEGLAERWGNTVLHCAYCHGYEMADQPLALYARGKSALTTVAMLWQLSRNLLLCSDGPVDLAEEELRALARRGVRIIETPLLRLGGVPGEPQLVLHFADGSTETRSALFLSTSVRVASRLPRELGCEFDGPGRLVLKDWRTTVPGVYAAGDLAITKRQVATAAASGVEAAMALNEDLIRDDAVFAERITPNGSVAKALSELRRVLKPDGRFLFAEHGLSPEPNVVRWQNRLTPLWKRIGGGCHLNRPIDKMISSAGFRLTKLETGYMKGPKPMTFMYEGEAHPL